MSIQPLSDSDVRAIGSSLVLNDARSVIKELIDNALDAHANTISIDISANTVDVIQVKDNGSGIGAGERGLLCKRGCTSKIRKIQDLETLGGSSFGFRGEALASVAGLSNAVVVTTRIDGELVGSTSTFGQNGLLLRQASHPVGTTVRVQDFLKTIPVRRQTAVKATSKTLLDIKKILQAYAFARPNVRISFKVLRAKSEKYNWTYGPDPGSTKLLRATAKIVGQEVAAQCEAKLWTSDADGGPGNTYVADAVVAKGEGDPVKVGTKGQFISLDGRPISTTRGVFKDFVKLYKAYYRHSIVATTTTAHPVDPFICLHLRCPPGSYDVNIEPAKDDVLFADTLEVRNLLEDFLKSVYGDLPRKTENRGSHDNAYISGIPQSQAFEVLLAKREPHLDERPKDVPRLDHSLGVLKQTGEEAQKESNLQHQTSLANESPESSQSGDYQLAAENSMDTGAKAHRNMYDFDEDDLTTMGLCSFSERSCNLKENDAELRKASVTNPWTLAKLNAPILSSTSPLSKAGSGTNSEQLIKPGPDLGVTDLVSTTQRQSFGRGTNLPSPARSGSSRSSPIYQNPGPPPRRRAPVHPAEDDDIEFTQESANEGSEPGRPTSLRLWAKSTPCKKQLRSPHRPSAMIDMDGRFEVRTRQSDHSSENAQNEMQSTQLTDPVKGLGEMLQSPKNARKPFIPPFRTPERPLGLHPPPKLTPTTSAPSKNQAATRQPSEWSQHGSRSTSPASHGHPAPLYHLHRHPMASPPHLQPSPTQISKSLKQSSHTPHSELDDIMDFEHRKKAVNAQRSSQSGLTNRYLNPGQLAQIQRESTASSPTSEHGLASSSPFRKHPAPSLNLRDDTENSYNPARPVGERFSDKPPPAREEPAHGAAPKRNPYQNRYQAAKAALTRPNPPTPFSHAHPPTEHEPIGENTHATETLPALPDDDPRAYLIQQRDFSTSRANKHTSDTIPDLARTALKIKRTKTSKLPFETIPLRPATYNISAKPLTPFPPLPNLSTQIHPLGRVDTYPRTGRTEFMVWDVDSMDVAVWESKIVALVRENYVAKLRLGDGGGEEIPANLQIRLGVALRAHCEEFV